MLRAVETAKGIAAKNVPVLLSGETGTGKEVLAKVIHDASQRSGKFVPVNCAALPKELVEAELFGTVRGAYTGAHQDRTGLIKQADNGTLFLDELSELSNAMQAKLLRVLQDKKVRPVGQNVEFAVDFRLIVALNVDPHILIDKHKLRPDLFYRINVVNIELPPLRERREDILPLAKLFLRHFASENESMPPTLTPEVEEKLLCHPWPGNVRQLQNEMMRLSALHDGEIKIKDLSAEFLRSTVNGTNGTYQPLTTMEDHEKVIIIETLAKCGGNKQLTAEVLGLGRQTLYNKMRRFGIVNWTPRREARPVAKEPELEQLAVQVQKETPPVVETRGVDDLNLL